MDVQAHLLTLLKAALRGESAQLPELSGEALSALCELASGHKVLPLVLEAAPFPLSPQLKSVLRRQVMTQALKTAEFLRLYTHLQSSGIQVIVVKGIVCRALYPKPDHRPSADEDLLVSPTQFSRCCQAMTAFGMTTDAANPGEAHELPFRGANSPLYIELHKHLFPPDSSAYGGWERFFENAFHTAVPMDIQGVQVLTLAPTEHMLYLIAHACKHFLHGGFGIRQVCDMALFARHYRDEIQWDRLRQSLRQLRAETFAGAVFAIAQRHLDIPAPWDISHIDEMPMLRDLLEGGIYGSATLSRRHSSHVTLSAAGETRHCGILAALFPPASSLQGRYPYLQKRKWLLPVAWCQRIASYASETRRAPDSTAAQALRIGTQRLTLLRQYGIID